MRCYAVILRALHLMRFTGFYHSLGFMKSAFAIVLRKLRRKLLLLFLCGFLIQLDTGAWWINLGIVVHGFRLLLMILSYIFIDGFGKPLNEMKKGFPLRSYQSLLLQFIALGAGIVSGVLLTVPSMLLAAQFLINKSFIPVINESMGINSSLLLLLMAWFLAWWVLLLAGGVIGR